LSLCKADLRLFEEDPANRRKKKPQQEKGAESGFTLLEVLVATVILGLAYLAVLQSFSFSLENILRIDNSKHNILSASLELEGLLRVSDLEEAPPVDGVVYLEGRRHKAVLVSSEDGRLVSVRIVRQ
jgi:prepilin-type N-terminal cleavage/methylation domain-containing protein